MSGYIFQDQSGIAQGISQAGGALGQALQASGARQFDQQKTLQQQQFELQKIQSKQDFETLKTQTKQNAFNSAYDASNEVGGITTQAGQQAFLKEFNRQGGDGLEALKHFKMDSKSETTFDKKLGEFKAESVINYLKDGEEGTNILKDNLDYLEANKKNVGRARGLATGEAFTNSAQFTEYRNRGNLALDGVIKVYNKSGALPQKKLEWIRKTFAISPWDTQEQIQGKINALRGLEKDGAAFSKSMGQLIEKYGPDIPNEEFVKIQQRLNDSVNISDEQVASPQKEQVVEKLSNKGYKKGNKATNSETGEEFVYNGKRWVKQK